MARTERLFGLRSSGVPRAGSGTCGGCGSRPARRAPGAGSLSTSTCSHAVVAPCSAPHSRSAPSTCGAQPLPAVLLVDLEVVQPEPVAVQRRLPAGHAVPDLDPDPPGRRSSL